MFNLAIRSLLNRRFVAALTILSIALSVALILGVERLREEARNSFTNSASGIDLIVAPRGNSVQILMATVFGVGSTGTGLAWETYKTVEALPQVAWSVPIQMGDNHHGYPVIGTNAAYFQRFRHSGGQHLELAAGRVFDDDTPDAAVVGAEVAARFGYTPGTIIINAHGAGSVSFDLHDDAPFTITGILAPTGTAMDRMVFVTIEGFDKLHAVPAPPPADPFDVHSQPSAPDEAPKIDGHSGISGHDQDQHAGRSGHADADSHHHEPAKINAIYIGLADRTAVLGIQRSLAELRTDAVSAVIPAVALTELWSITGTAERAMQAMAWAVALAGMTGMVVMLSATLEARRREFAILRSVGATPRLIFTMMLTEAGLLMGAGIGCGLAFLAVAVRLSNPLLSSQFGLTLDLGLFLPQELALLSAIFAAGLAASLAPALRVYCMTLADGLSVRL